MNRPTSNFLIDAVAIIAFAFLTAAGVLTRCDPCRVPPGTLY